MGGGRLGRKKLRRRTHLLINHTPHPVFSFSSHQGKFTDSRARLYAAEITLALEVRLSILVLFSPFDPLPIHLTFSSSPHLTTGVAQARHRVPGPQGTFLYIFMYMYMFVFVYAYVCM